MKENYIVYLTMLQNKVFKLLPMREAYDLGEDNHVYEFLENLLNNIPGAVMYYPALKSEGVIVEVQGNLVFLRDKGVPFNKWRSVVLRTTRLIHSLIDKLESGG